MLSSATERRLHWRVKDAIAEWAGTLTLGVALRTSAVIAIAVVWVVMLWPTTLGGRAQSVIVISDSMEPTLYRGDLAFLRREDSYQIGDAVVFRVGRALVIHRIIGGNARDGYITQGDNRDRPDRWRPRPDEIAGRMWLRVPDGGLAVLWLRKPQHLAVLVGLSVFIAVMMGDEKELRLPGRGKAGT